MSKGFFYAGLICVLWAVLIITPVWLPDFSAADIVFGRFLVCALTAVAILLFRQDTLLKITVSLLRKSVLLSGLGCVLFYLMLVASVRLVGVFPAIILFGALPLISQLQFGWSGKPAVWATAGLALLVTAFWLVAETCCGQSYWVSGFVYLALSLVLYQLYVLFQRQFIKVPLGLDRNDLLLVSGLAAIPCLFLMLLLYFVNDPLFGLFQSIHSSERWRIFWLLSILGGGFSSLIARGIWLHTLSATDPVRLTRYSVFLPACSSFFVCMGTGHLPAVQEWEALGALILALYIAYRFSVISRVLKA